MTGADARDLSPGLYIVHWKEGGSSKAAIGVTRSGNRWLAPINWVSPAIVCNWDMVKSVTALNTIEWAEQEVRSGPRTRYRDVTPRDSAGRRWGEANDDAARRRAKFDEETESVQWGRSPSGCPVCGVEIPAGVRRQVHLSWHQIQDRELESLLAEIQRITPK